MNLARLKQELSLIVLDKSLERHFADWLNEAVDEIAFDFDLPSLKLRSPVNFAVTTANWLYDPPSSRGTIAAIAITNGGTDYAEGDILDILETGATGGNLVVTEILGPSASPSISPSISPSASPSPSLSPSTSPSASLSPSYSASLSTSASPSASPSVSPSAEPVGVVTGVQLIDGGMGYSVGSGKATYGGGNNDLTIQIVSLVEGQVVFHKRLFKAADSNWSEIEICKRWEELDARDIDHDDTGDHVTKIAITPDGSKVGIYPKATETLKLWFYERPTPMVLESDEPTCIPVAYRLRVIIPKVVIKNFKYLQDLIVQPPHESLLWWEEEYRKGLYGAPGGDIGMINYIARAIKPRRHGGVDPIGQRY